MRPPDQAISTYPAQTVDFLPLVDLTINGVPVTDPADVSVAVVGEWTDPSVFTPAELRDGVIGFVLDGPTLGRGVFNVYVRSVKDDLAPVIPAGRVRLR